MRFFKKIENYISNIKLNAQLNKYKYVHIMFNDKFNKPFVDFLNRNFDNNEHIILCKRWFVEFPFPIGKNVFEIKTLKNLDFTNNKKIICHSLFDQELIDYLYSNQSLLKAKAYWIIWGGDLYNAPRDKKNDYVRSNFKGYWSVADEEAVIEKYNTNNNFKRISYIFPISKNIIDNVKKEKKDFIRIQINNSCDNSTLEMLDILSKFKNENIKITTILSYGKMQFKDKIIKKGTEIFGDKFEYINELLSAEDYAHHLAQNDILILNQNRQQGVGNTLASLYIGNKVYINSKVLTYNFFNNQNIKVFASDSIENLSYKQFIENQDRDITSKNVYKYFDEKHLAKLWESAIYE